MNRWLSTPCRSRSSRWHCGEGTLYWWPPATQAQSVPLMGSGRLAVLDCSFPSCTLLRTSLAFLTLCRRPGGQRSSSPVAAGTSPRWTQVRAWALRTCCPTRKWFAVSGCWDSQPHSSERCAAPPHPAWCSIAPSWHKANRLQDRLCQDVAPAQGFTLCCSLRGSSPFPARRCCRRNSAWATCLHLGTWAPQSTQQTLLCNPHPRKRLLDGTVSLPLAASHQHLNPA